MRHVCRDERCFLIYRRSPDIQAKEELWKHIQWVLFFPPPCIKTHVVLRQRQGRLPTRRDSLGLKPVRQSSLPSLCGTWNSQWWCLTAPAALTSLLLRPLSLAWNWVSDRPNKCQGKQIRKEKKDSCYRGERQDFVGKLRVAGEPATLDIDKLEDSRRAIEKVCLPFFLEYIVVFKSLVLPYISIRFANTVFWDSCERCLYLYQHHNVNFLALCRLGRNLWIHLGCQKNN